MRRHDPIPIFLASCFILRESRASISMHFGSQIPRNYLARFLEFVSCDLFLAIFEVLVVHFGLQKHEPSILALNLLVQNCGPVPTFENLSLLFQFASIENSDLIY